MLSFTSGAAAIVAFAVICQVLVERIKPLIPEFKGKSHAIQYVTILVGIVIAVSFKVDIFSTLGAEEYPLVLAYILTGLLISGGATFVNDVFKLVAGAKDNKFNNNASDTNVQPTPQPQPVVKQQPAPEIVAEEKPVAYENIEKPQPVAEAR